MAVLVVRNKILDASMKKPDAFIGKRDFVNLKSEFGFGISDGKFGSQDATAETFDVRSKNGDEM